MPLSWARFVCLAKQVFNKCVGVSDLGARSVELSKSLLLLLKVPLLVCLGFGGAGHAAFGTSSAKYNTRHCILAINLRVLNQQWKIFPPMLHFYNNSNDKPHDQQPEEVHAGNDDRRG